MTAFQAPTLPETLFSALERLGEVFQLKTGPGRQLSALQSRILITLARQSGSLNFSQIVQQLDVSRANSTISTSLNSLVKQGLLHKNRNPVDRRQFCFGLSPAGQEAATQLQAFKTQVQQSLTALSQPQQVQLLKSLLMFLHQLQLNGLISVEGMCFLCRYFVLEPEAYCELLQKPLAETPLPRNWYQLPVALKTATNPADSQN